MGGENGVEVLYATDGLTFATGLSADDLGGGGEPGPIDVDSDGFPAGADCDDLDATVFPGAPEVCGDGIDQDCSGGDVPCPPPTQIKRVFYLPAARLAARAGTAEGGFGGLLAADAACRAEAQAAGLPGAGVANGYRAFLCGDNLSAANRLTHATAPYVTTAGTVVANDWNDLTDFSLLAPINRDAFGAVVGGPAWTGCSPQGFALSGGGHTCSDWTSSSFFSDATVGSAFSVGGGWVQQPSEQDCDEPAGLYCLQQ
ncbi:MAG: putative metal-binding motif-containing protein [Alphaproteobacteria bacterium]|nr:putative metal-binding motif-containing protein [Alphaproteobacteria bacterium]